jgi:ATP-dependent DNA helicase DinG
LTLSLVNRDLNPLLTSLPEKFTEVYDYQIDSILEIVEGFQDHKLVVLEAPTGSGKTVIAEIVRRMLETRASYVCHNKELQAQFDREFPYSKILYGRANYIPNGKKTLGTVTCEDCTWTQEKPECVLCPERTKCPYIVAKNDAIHSPVPILNSAYWLNEVQGKGSRFANTGLAIIDEADTLESVLMNQVEVYVSAHRQSQYHIKPPTRMTKNFESWCVHATDQLQKGLSKLSDANSMDLRRAREKRYLLNLVGQVQYMRGDLVSGQPWVYTGGAGSERRRGDIISFRPVKVNRFGPERIWSKDRRFLVMSGSPNLHLDVQALGYEDSYKRVQIESQFAPVNRQVIVRPICDMTAKGVSDNGLRLLGNELRNILSVHAGDRVLIHCVSYKRGDIILNAIRGQRQLFTYGSAMGRGDAIRDFKATPASVLIASSADRGVDLPDDACRVQIITKVPFPYLGDKQVAERRHNTPDGHVWYNNQVARTIMQMVGRGVRSKEDHCVTYVLDSSFVGWYRAWGHLFPAWFKRAIRIEHIG